MRPIRAVIAAITVGSFLIWIYCIGRIFTAGPFIQFQGPFIDGLPGSFLQISMASFIIFLTSFFSYLVLEEIDK